MTYDPIAHLDRLESKVDAIAEDLVLIGSTLDRLEARQARPTAGHRPKATVVETGDSFALRLEFGAPTVDLTHRQVEHLIAVICEEMPILRERNEGRA